VVVASDPVVLVVDTVVWALRTLDAAVGTVAAAAGCRGPVHTLFRDHEVPSLANTNENYNFDMFSIRVLHGHFVNRYWLLDEFNSNFHQRTTTIDLIKGAET
jgi:hypothetical protein